MTAKRRRGRPATQANTELRSKLLEAALISFGEKGFDGASLSQIAGRAGTDIGLTRYYFGSKESLWKEAVGFLGETLRVELEAVLTNPEIADSDRLEQVIRWFIDISARHPYLSRIIVLDGTNDDDRSQYILRIIVGPFFRILSRLLSNAADHGRIPDVSPRTLFFMITHGGSFPMAMPALTNGLPGGKINSARALNAHADAIIKLVLR